MRKVKLNFYVKYFSQYSHLHSTEIIFRYYECFNVYETILIKTV